MRLVAGRAPLRLHRRMLKRKRPTRLSVTLDAALVAGGYGHRAIRQRRGVHIVAVAALYFPLGNWMMTRQPKGLRNLGVACAAKRNLLVLQLGFHPSIRPRQMAGSAGKPRPGMGALAEFRMRLSSVGNPTWHRKQAQSRQPDERQYHPRQPEPRQKFHPCLHTSALPPSFRIGQAAPKPRDTPRRNPETMETKVALVVTFITWMACQRAVVTPIAAKWDSRKSPPSLREWQRTTGPVVSLSRNPVPRPRWRCEIHEAHSFHV